MTMVKQVGGSSVDKKMESLKRGGMSIKRANEDQDAFNAIDEVLSSAEEQTDRLMRRYDLIG